MAVRYFRRWQYLANVVTRYHFRQRLSLLLRQLRHGSSQPLDIIIFDGWLALPLRPQLRRVQVRVDLRSADIGVAK